MPTMTPIWVSTMTGRTPRTVKTGGEQDAGRRDDPSGGAQRSDHRGAGVAADGGLLSGAGHQEDVVVHAQGDPEQEAEQEYAGVQGGDAVLGRQALQHR